MGKAVVLNRIIRVNLAQKLNLKPRLEGSEGVRLRGERVSDSEGKGPEVGACLVCSKNRKMASEQGYSSEAFTEKTQTFRAKEQVV